MGLFIGQNEKRSELQSKIIAELQEKARQTSNDEGDGNDIVDTTPEPTFLENQHETRTAGVLITLLVFIFVVVVIFIVARSR